jgi:hypothetical protein
MPCPYECIRFFCINEIFRSFTVQIDESFLILGKFAKFETSLSATVLSYITTTT